MFDRIFVCVIAALCLYISIQNALTLKKIKKDLKKDDFPDS